MLIEYNLAICLPGKCLRLKVGYPEQQKESPIELREDEKNGRDQLVIEELFLKNGVNGLNLAFAAILYPENLKFARFNFGGWCETNQWYAL